ncbi:MAG: lysophospholipid transporter LplT [Methylococcales bacterium]|nr:lysophospholipid transporter LplT [Methylococcales bacterium]
MNTSLIFLLIAQFLSAFADNAILFTVIALVMHAQTPETWYVPALQSSFLVAFVLLAPWTGTLADNFPKARVLIAANLLKACGAFLLLLNVEPLIAYAIVGSGAAIYSPAKYGILPELVKHDELVKANGWIEGSTILAILLGMVIGAKVADFSIQIALFGTIGLFLVSSGFAWLLGLKIPPAPLFKGEEKRSSVREFFAHIGQFFTLERARFVILGGSLFWASAATLRVILVAWSPQVLNLHSATDIAQLTLFLAIGIIIGSAIVPRLIPLEHLRRARFAAYAMAVLIVSLSFTAEIWTARSVLFLIGIMGGVFIVPINAALQEVGQQTIGSGHAIALQGFFQNVAMLLAVGSYSLAASQQVNSIAAMLCLGIALFVSAVIVAFNLPRDSS